jgi:hypothetical protein
MRIRAMIVPTLRVGMPFRTLCVQADAERQSLRYHAERGSDQQGSYLDDRSYPLLGRRWFFVLPNGRSVPPSAGYLKRHQVTKCPCSWLGPTSSGSFTPATLRGPAAIRHPWRGAALAASMPLGPLHATCVQPAPKSRLVVSALLRSKIKIDGNGDGKHRTCSRPACRRWRFHIRHPRPNGTPPGHTATRRGACI